MEYISFLMAASVVLGVVAGIVLELPAWKDIVVTALLGSLVVGVAVVFGLGGELNSPSLKGLLLLDRRAVIDFYNASLFIGMGYLITISSVCFFFRKIFGFSNKHANPAHQNAPGEGGRPQADTLDVKDYERGPVADIFRGPLLETPQGVACVLFSALNVLAGLIWLYGPESVTKAPLFGAGPVLLLYPIIMFLGFIKVGRHDNFAPSYFAAAVIVLIGLLPLVGPFFRYSGV